MRIVVAPVGAAILMAATGLASAAAPSAAAIEAATFSPLPDKPSGKIEPVIVKAEVLLGRARFSPGSIDGRPGDNMDRAIAAFQKQSGLPVTRTLDKPTWDKLVADTAPVMTRYVITAADAKGPFTPHIPTQFEKQATLKTLGYRDIREALAERFHMAPALLGALNAGHRFAAGETIAVVATAGTPSTLKAASVVVDKSGHAVLAYGLDGTLIATYPASIGSDEKPAPSGRFVIRRVVHHPDYTYLPKFHFKGVTSKQPFTIAPGPNNPVGAVWIDLSDEGYGIHGTPEPDLVGKTQSHGCIRLTNWDVEALAVLVDQGVPVTFQDNADNPVPPVPASPAPTPPDALSSIAGASRPAPLPVP